MTSEYLCNLVVPGAAKSGTSSLHEYLDHHPMISMSSDKEPHFFCRDDLYCEGADFHNEFFDDRSGTRYFGESSTGYLPWPPAAERVASDLCEPRAIFILRHPVERCFSHYRWRVRLGLERRSFLDAVRTDGYGFHPDRPDRFGYRAYLEFSNYSKHCPIWESALGPENCLFLSTDELRRDQQSVMARCFRFLGLPDVDAADKMDTKNETDALGRIPPGPMTVMARFVPYTMKQSALYQTLKEKILKAGAPAPPRRMTTEERAYVEDRLASDIGWYAKRFPSAKEP